MACKVLLNHFNWAKSYFSRFPWQIIPITHRTVTRRKMRQYICPRLCPIALYLEKANGMAVPLQNRKSGMIQSCRVRVVVPKGG